VPLSPLKIYFKKRPFLNRPGPLPHKGGKVDEKGPLLKYSKKVLMRGGALLVFKPEFRLKKLCISLSP